VVKISETHFLDIKFEVPKWYLKPQIRDGYAWVYRKDCKKRFCQDWLALEESTKRAGKGMWADPHIVPPWGWRKAPRK